MQYILYKIFSILTRRDKRLFIMLVGMSIFISLIEMVGVGAILPFISIASDFSNIHDNQYIKKIYVLFNSESEQQFIVIVGIVLIVFYLIRTLLNMWYFYLLSKFAKGRFHLLAYRLFENYLGMSYRNFIEKNSSALSKTIINEAQNMTNMFSGLLLMLSEIFVVIFIYAFMLYVNWKITVIITVFLLMNIMLLFLTVSKSIKNAGIKRESFQQIFAEIINSTLANFKMIKLTANYENVLEKFKNASLGYTDSNVRNETLSHVPRLFLEAIGFGMIIFIVTFIVYKFDSDISSFLPIISVFVLGLYRLMPSVNRILLGYNQVLFNQRSLEIIHNDLMYDSENLGNKSLTFNKDITLENITFEYVQNKPILSGINLTINKGDKIVIIGESGSGKSTLIDIIIGMYHPKNGIILIDNMKLEEENVKAWRSRIGYIPQSIYLFEGTVAENVAFGKEICEEQIKKVLMQANILKFLESSHEGIYTNVGEGGVKLSGGQKQRIAIARALYSEPDILVFDEATSALDSQTEYEIMEEIHSVAKNKTLIIITHKLNTIKENEHIFKLVNGILTKVLHKRVQETAIKYQARINSDE